LPESPAADDRPHVLTVASPLPYLFAEEARADRQASEALFLTFNADLGFFERTILGVTLATGARVTVVGDARMSAPDPRAARNAGSRYTFGLAATPAGTAFHPKVTAVVGPERAVLAIGSGNLSAGGWHLNEEIWVVATADRDHCPAIVPQLAEWLRTLPEMCRITQLAAQRIRRTAAGLEQLTGASTVSETGHVLAHSSAGPIIGQLPRRPVSRLLLYAPFHDQRGEAIRQLVEQLAPTEVTLVVQSGGRTVIQPQVVAEVMADLAVPLNVFEDSTSRYRHGKLIECVGPDGSRWSLTGSPNLSGNALLRGADRGGNIEMGVLASASSASLLPKGQPTSIDSVVGRRIDNEPLGSTDRWVILIGATRSETGLRVAFATAPGHEVRIAVSIGTAFDTWKPIGTVPAGEADHELTDTVVPAGTRVRAEWDTDSGPVRSAIVFVNDADRLLSRHDRTQSRGRIAPPDPMNLITDARLMEIWAQSLAQLASARMTTAVPRAASPSTPRGESESEHHGAGLRLDADQHDWVSYVDGASARLGSSVIQLALGGFPALHRGSRIADVGIEEPTDRVIVDSKPGLEADAELVGQDNDVSATTDPVGDGTSETGADQASANAGIPDQHDQPEGEKRRGRRMLTNAVFDYAPQSPAIDRLAILKLVMCAIETGIWAEPTGDGGWFTVLKGALSNLADCQMPEQLEKHVGSLAALAVYLMHEHRPTTARTADVLLYEEVAHATGHLYAQADPTLVEVYAEPFTNASGYPVDPDAVMHVVSMIVQDDPLIDAMDVLESRHPGWRLTRLGDAALLIRGVFGPPFLAAAEALDAVHGLNPAGAWAMLASTDWAIAARDGNSLVRVDSQRNHLTWRHHRLTNLIGPFSIARDQELANRVRIPHGPLSQEFDEARQILAVIGIDVRDPPSTGNP
jgi:hypothetical protein